MLTPLQNNSGSTGLFLLVAFGVILAPTAYVYRDAARRRNRSETLLAAITFFAGVVGLVVGSYLILGWYLSVRD